MITRRRMPQIAQDGAMQQVAQDGFTASVRGVSSAQQTQQTQHQNPLPSHAPVAFSLQKLEVS